MIYRAESKTVLEMVVESTPVSDERLAELARLLGRTVDGGKPVEVVGLVFIDGACAEAQVNNLKRFGIQCRGIFEGEERILYEGTRVTSSDGEITGTLLPILREASWPHLDTAVHRRLLGDNVADGPWVTFCWDQGNTVARFSPSHLKGRTIGDVEAEALANLEKRTPKIQEIAPGSLAVLEEYGAEMLLLPSFQRTLAERLGTEMLAVGAPKEGGFLVTDATAIDRVMALTAWCRKHFDEAKGRRISPLPLLLGKGGVVGYLVPKASDDGDGPTVTKGPDAKPWWRFW